MFLIRWFFLTTDLFSTSQFQKSNRSIEPAFLARPLAAAHRIGEVRIVAIAQVEIAIATRVETTATCKNIAEIDRCPMISILKLGALWSFLLI